MNLLYLVHRVPYPPNRGDRIRSYHLLRFLAARHRVHLACLADEPVPETDLEALAPYCANLTVIPLGARSRWLRGAAALARGKSASEGLFESPRLAKVVAGWARQVRFDAVVVFCSSMVPLLRLRELANVPAVVDLVDVDSQKWLDYAAGAGRPKRWLFALEGRRVRQLETEAARRAGAMAVVSEAEAELCRGHCAATRVMGIPNGVDLDYFGKVGSQESGDRGQETGPVAPVDSGIRNPKSKIQNPKSSPSPLTPSSLLFVGALDYRANIDGITWFCREVWPELHREGNRTTLTLVGRNPAPAVRKLAEVPGVCVIGSVPDVRPYLARATVVVAPLRVARGIQNKVLEALAARRAVVASSGALEGIDLDSDLDRGPHALRADTPAEWMRAIRSLLNDAELRERLAESGRAFVERNHNWERCLAPFDELLSRAVGAASATSNPEPLPV